MREGGTCGSGSEGSEAEAIVCCCLAGSVDSLSCFVSFPNPFHLLVLAFCTTEPARQPPPPLQCNRNMGLYPTAGQLVNSGYNTAPASP
jgi:hypothetical protein